MARRKVTQADILTEWMKQGRIPYKRMGKRIYFNKEDVMASMTNFNHNKGGK